LFEQKSVITIEFHNHNSTTFLLGYNIAMPMKLIHPTSIHVGLVGEESMIEMPSQQLAE
jgi:hypothetical protein